VVIGFVLIGPYISADGTARVVKGWAFTAVTGSILVLSICYYFLVIPDRSGRPLFRFTSAVRRWSIIRWTGARARIEEREGGFDESYGFRRTLRVTFPEDTPEARVSEISFVSCFDFDTKYKTRPKIHIQYRKRAFFIGYLVAH
jgi:hypothetical protein